MKKVCLPLIAGCLVVFIGIYIAVKLWYWCAAHFPKPDQTDPPISPSNVVDQVEYFSQPEQDSQPDAPAPQEGFGPTYSGCFFTVRIHAEPDGIHLGCATAQSVSLDEFRSDLNALGAPTNHNETVTWNGRILTIGEGVPVAVEQSADLLHWEPVVTLLFDLSRTLDLTLPAPCSGNSFWRVRQ